MIPAEDPIVLSNYLIKQGFAHTVSDIRIAPMPGGVSNKVMKITLPGRKLVLKQALAKLNVKDDWFADPSRIFTEKNCLKLIQEVLPEHVPALVHEDEENFLFIMECLPDEAVVWKEWLLSGHIDTQHAELAARVLARLHSACYKHTGRMAPFLSKKMFIDLRIDPYYQKTAAVHPKIQSAVAYITEISLSDQSTLVLGDYSPKNMLISGEQFFILDFEVAHYGDPSFDVAFLLNHLILKSMALPAYQSELLHLAAVFYRTYENAVSFELEPDLGHRTACHLPLLMLSRVDGTSPVEYLHSESLKQRVRDLAFTLLHTSGQRVPELLELIRFNQSHED